MTSPKLIRLAASVRTEAQARADRQHRRNLERLDDMLRPLEIAAFEAHKQHRDDARATRWALDILRGLYDENGRAKD